MTKARMNEAGALTRSGKRLIEYRLISDANYAISNDIEKGCGLMTCFEWIVTEGADVTFAQADAIRITRFSAPTFQNWANREIVEPLTKGVGTRRRYSAQTLAIMAIAARIQELNVSTTSSIATATLIWIDAVKDLMTTHKRRRTLFSELGGAVAIIKAESKVHHNVTVALDPTKLPIKDLLSGFPCIVLAIGPVIERIATAAMALHADANAEV